MHAHTHDLLKQEEKVVIPGWGKDTSWFLLDQEGDQEMNSGTTRYPAYKHSRQWHPGTCESTQVVGAGGTKSIGSLSLCNQSGYLHLLEDLHWDVSCQCAFCAS